MYCILYYIISYIKFQQRIAVRLLHHCRRRLLLGPLNSRGQLGIGSKTDSTIPAPVSGGLHFVTIATGDGRACGVTAGSKGYCWGDNEYGQLGNGSGGLTFDSPAVGKTFTSGVTVTGVARAGGG
jgi:alpha-tubulin suppressor-like RCC1 family protein